MVIGSYGNLQIKTFSQTPKHARACMVRSTERTMVPANSSMLLPIRKLDPESDGDYCLFPAADVSETGYGVPHAIISTR